MVHNYSFGVLFMNVFAPLMLANKSAKSSLSFIPAPFSASFNSAVREVPPISFVRASPSRGVGSASFSLAPKFSTGPTLYPPLYDSTLKSSSYSLAYLYLSPPFFWDCFLLSFFFVFFADYFFYFETDASY